MNPRSSYSMALAAHDISDVLDKLTARQLERHSWLIRAGEQIRNQEGGGLPNKQPASNSR